LVAIVVVLLLTPAIVYVWIQRVADRRWAAAERRIHELVAAWPAEVPRPPTATSSETAKDIQSLFVAAIREASSRRDDNLYSVATVNVVARPSPCDRVVEDAAEILDRVHRGARKSREAPAEFPPSWRGDWDREALTYVMNSCILLSRRCRKSGKPSDAVAALFDFLPLARFWAQSGSGICRFQATDTLGVLLDELRDLLSSEELPAEELRRLEAELETAEGWQRLPFGDIEARLARWSEWLLTMDPESQGILKGAPYRWRFLLSERQMKAEAFEHEERCARLFRSCEGKPYLDLKRCREDSYEDIERSRNPLVMNWSLFGHDEDWSVWRRLAELRLLRSAARYRASGEFLGLADPFGTLLQHSPQGVRMKFWSLGINGMNDGGQVGPKGTWRDMTLTFFEQKVDLVLDVALRIP